AEVERGAEATLLDGAEAADLVGAEEVRQRVAGGRRARADLREVRVLPARRPEEDEQFLVARGARGGRDLAHDGPRPVGPMLGADELVARPAVAEAGLVEDV